MKTFGILLGLVALVAAKPQDIPPPSSEPPPLPPLPPPESSLPIPPPQSTVTTPPAPTVTPEPGQGPICECGYTYCSSVLMNMKSPWNEQALAEAYCSTSNAVCNEGAPATDIMSALFICLCENEDDEVGIDLDLLCGCDECLVIGPDYRGRCKTPCSSEPCLAKA